MKLPKKFNSRENDHIRYEFTSPETGVRVKQDFFVGRSHAVVAIIFAFTKEGPKVLITKRSKRMMDHPLYLSLPCGYLDWDETRYEGMMREVYEETSFYIPDSEEYMIYNNDGEPIIVKDKPTENRQNISSIYLLVFNFMEEPEAFPSNVEDFKCKEVEWVRWMDMDDFDRQAINFNWAFNHDETIIKGFLHWNNLPYNKD